MPSTKPLMAAIEVAEPITVQETTMDCYKELNAKCDIVLEKIAKKRKIKNCPA